MSAIDHVEFNRQLWAQLAEPWERRREWHELQLEPVTSWLLARLRPQQGETVLELAAGNGETGLRVADAIGGSGRLVMTDLAPAMLGTARRRGDQLGLTNVEYSVMNAEQLDLPDSSVDAVVCRYGYMLMPDRERALAETARVLRPGGRLCFAVFAAPLENQFFIVPGSVLIERGHFQPDPSGPHMFTMSDPDQLSLMLSRVGFDDPEIEKLDTPYRFADAADLWSWVREMAGPLALAIGHLDQVECASVRTAIEERAEPFRQPDGSYELPSASLLVSAVRRRPIRRAIQRSSGTGASGRRATYSLLADLPLVIDSYSTQPLTRGADPESTPHTNVVLLYGGQHEGVGEDVTPFPPAQLALRRSEPDLPLAGTWTVSSFSSRLDELELYSGIQLPPGFPKTFRRWAFESAALDLALRQAGISLTDALGRRCQPVSFVNSPLLDADPIGVIQRRLEAYPTLRFKLDPSPDWGQALIDELAATGAVTTVDLKGQYPPQAPIAIEPNPDLYQRLAKGFPDAWLEDPGLTPATSEVLQPHHDRITWDLPVRTPQDIEQLPIPPRAVNIKPARHGTLQRLLDVYDHCAMHGIATYGGGMGELGPGRGQNQYLASIFHPHAPNDIAPVPYNDHEPPPDLPASPLKPTPDMIGFRWEANRT
jgi:SAM-dependent methyltransferase/L-alanine-DL-glutamate epimerase-like enolase superfamily enzyme